MTDDERRRKWITEDDLLTALRKHEQRRSMGEPHPFSERWVADMWFDLPPAQPVPSGLAEARDKIAAMSHSGTVWTGDPLLNRRDVLAILDAALTATTPTPDSEP